MDIITPMKTVEKCLGCNGQLGVGGGQNGGYTFLYCRTCKYTYYAIEETLKDPYYEDLPTDGYGLPEKTLKEGQQCQCLLFRGVSDFCICKGEASEDSESELGYYEETPRVTPPVPVYYFDSKSLSCCGPVGSYNGSCHMFWETQNGEMISDIW